MNEQQMSMIESHEDVILVDDGKDLDYLKQKAESLSQSEATKKVEGQWSLVEVNLDKIRQAAILAAAEVDPEFGRKLAQLEDVRAKINQLAEKSGESVSKELEELVEENKNLFDYLDKTVVVLDYENNLNARARINLFIRGGSKNQSALRNLSELIGKPEVDWDYAVQDGIIQPKLNGDLEGFAALWEANAKMRIIREADGLDEDQRLALTAKLGVEMEAKGLPPALFKDALVDPDLFGERFFTDSIASYFNLEDDLEEAKLNRRQTVGTRTMASTVVLGCLVMTTYPIYSPRAIEEKPPLVEEMPEDPIRQLRERERDYYESRRQYPIIQGEDSRVLPDTMEGQESRGIGGSEIENNQNLPETNEATPNNDERRGGSGEYGRSGALPDTQEAQKTNQEAKEGKRQMGEGEGVLPDTQFGLAQNQGEIQIEGTAGEGNDSGEGNGERLGNQMVNGVDEGGNSRNGTKQDESEWTPKNDGELGEGEPGSEENWHFRGKVPSGYQRLGAAIEWNESSKSWSLTEEKLSSVSNITTYPLAYETELEAERRIHLDGLTSTSIFIPTPEGYLMHISHSNFSINNRRLLSDEYELNRFADGRVELLFKAGVIGDVVIEAGYFPEKYLDPDSRAFSAEQLRGFSEANKLSDEREMLERARSLIQSTGDHEKVAGMIVDWYKQNYIYSLNPAYSDYYNNALMGQEYWSRIAEERKGDCDVVNSYVIAALRSVGIKSRLVLGYYNTTPVEELSETKEKHAWIEIRVEADGEFPRVVRKDATPVTKDEYTKNLDEMERGTQGNQEGVGVERMLKQLEQDLKQALLEKDLALRSLGGGGLGLLGTEFGRESVSYLSLLGGSGLWWLINKRRYKEAVTVIKNRVQEETNEAKDRSHYTMEASIMVGKVLPKELSLKGRSKKWLRVLDNALQVFFPPISYLDRIKETRFLGKFKKRLEGINIGGIKESSKLLAEVAGKSVEQIKQTIETENINSISQGLGKKIRTRLLAFEYNHSRVTVKENVNFSEAKRQSKNVEEFIQTVSKQYYKQVLISAKVGNRKMSIWQKHKFFGGTLFSGIPQPFMNEVISPTLKAYLEAYWRIKKGLE